MRTIQRDIVAAMIFSKDNELLMVQKNQSGGGVYIDCWHLPGGGVDAGETKEQAIVREVAEEVGIHIETYPLAMVDDAGSGTAEKTMRDTGEKVQVEMLFTVFKIVIEDKSAREISVSLSDELGSYQWFAKEELKDVKLTPPSVILFEKLGYIKT